MTPASEIPSARSRSILSTVSRSVARLIFPAQKTLTAITINKRTVPSLFFLPRMVALMRYLRVLAEDDRQVVNPRAFPAVVSSSSAYFFRSSAPASFSTISSQESSRSSSAFFIAIHTRGCSQPRALQNLRKNLVWTSFRCMWCSSCDKISSASRSNTSFPEGM